MSEKAIVFYCKTCDALFFAVMQSVAGDYAQQKGKAARGRTSAVSATGGESMIDFDPGELLLIPEAVSWKQNPCPRCGSTEVGVELEYAKDVGVSYTAYCQNAGCEARTAPYATHAAAVTAWNRGEGMSDKVTFDGLLTGREVGYDHVYEKSYARLEFLGVTDGVLDTQTVQPGNRYRVTLEYLPVEPEPQSDRYPMCDDQPAQIDCRRADCRWNRGGGNCMNLSPPITLDEKHEGSATCWSAKPKEPELARCWFCENSTPRVITLARDKDHRRYQVHCGGCGASGPSRASKSAAIAAWNRRTP